MPLTRFIYQGEQQQRERSCKLKRTFLISGKFEGAGTDSSPAGAWHLALWLVWLGAWQLDALHLNLFKIQLLAKTRHSHKGGVKFECASCVCVCAGNNAWPLIETMVAGNGPGCWLGSDNGQDAVATVFAI